MEMLGVKNPAMMKWRKQKRNDDVMKKKKEKEKNIKVTYISSPMKVKTSASNFRALVQELTGQDSNVAEKFLDSAADHDDDENIAAMASASSHGDQEQWWKVGGEHDDDDDKGNVLHQKQGSWLDLLSDDYSEFQYSRSMLESFNQHHHLKFDLVGI